MADKVVDDSALAALLFGEPEGERIARRLVSASLFAPTLSPFEVANVRLTKVCRYPDIRDGLVASFSLLAHMTINTVDAAFDETLALAESAGLTVYDASYLWLAKAYRMGGPVVIDAKVDPDVSHHEAVDNAPQ